MNRRQERAGRLDARTKEISFGQVGHFIIDGVRGWRSPAGARNGNAALPGSLLSPGSSRRFMGSITTDCDPRVLIVIPQESRVLQDLGNCSRITPGICKCNASPVYKSGLISARQDWERLCPSERSLTLLSRLIISYLPYLIGIIAVYYPFVVEIVSVFI